MVIDGEVLDGKRVKYLTKDGILAKEYLTEIQGLKNWIDSYKGQIDALKNNLAGTQYQLDQARYGRPVNFSAFPVQSLDNITAKQLAAELQFRIHRRLMRWLRPTQG
jgi:hypothetical protein